MSETQDNALMRFLNEKLVPFSTKVAQNQHIQAIGQGAMGLMAIILVGSIFNLLNTLPFEPYYVLTRESYRASALLTQSSVNKQRGMPAAH